MEEISAPPASQSQAGALGVAKPTGQPYINWCQAFRSSYRGDPQPPAEMVRMAAERWRGMSDEEKRPFVEMAAAERAKPKSARQKDLKRLQSLRARPVARPEEAAIRPAARRVKPSSRRARGAKAKAKARGAAAAAGPKKVAVVKANNAKRTRPKRKPKRKPKRTQRRSRSRSSSPWYSDSESSG